MTGWRLVDREVCVCGGDSPPPIGSILPQCGLPWTPYPTVTFHMQVGHPLQPTATNQQKRGARTGHLAALQQCAIWVWTDGYAEAGVLKGGAGVYIERPEGEDHELRRAAGRICPSFRAELIALREALQFLRDNPAHTEDPVGICTDSPSALASIQGCPSAQTSQLGIDIWRALRELAGNGRQIILQCVPSHRGLGGNERVDSIAKEASSVSQETVVEVQTVHRAAARLAKSRTTQAWPAGWHRPLMGQRLPPPVSAEERSAAVDVHQLRAGHWSGSSQWRHRVGQHPSRQCPQCDEMQLHSRAAL